MARLSSTTSCFFRLSKSLSVSSAGFSRHFRSRSSASDLADAGSGMEVSNAVGRNEGATGLTHCFSEGLLGLFASFSKVFVLASA